MDLHNFKDLIAKIVEKATELKNKHTDEAEARVNYACIFCQNKREFEEFNQFATQLGTVIEDTPTGKIFKISPLNTVSGMLQLLKIRSPDETRKERGDADFTALSYEGLKKKCLKKKGFSLIKRDNFEMIELIDKKFDVRVYFSSIPLDKQLGIITNYQAGS